RATSSFCKFRAKRGHLVQETARVTRISRILEQSGGVKRIFYELNKSSKYRFQLFRFRRPERRFHELLIKMNDASIPTMFQKTFVKHGIEICRHFDFKTLEDESKTWLCLMPIEKWEESMYRRISKVLNIPSNRKQILKLVKPLSLEISSWNHDHYAIMENKSNFQESFCWTEQGTINRLQTAKNILKTNLDLRRKFVLACMYFLEKDIKALWLHMTPSEKISVKTVSDSLIVELWTVALRERRKFHWTLLGNKILSSDNSYDILDISISLPYFLKKLEADVGLHCFATSINHRFLHPEQFRVCLLQLNRDEQMKIFGAYALKVLLYFLHWPHQEMFFDVAGIVMPYLSERDFFRFVHCIIREVIAKKWSDVDYVKLFKAFWQMSPDTFKDNAKENEIHSALLVVLGHNLDLQFFPMEQLLPNVAKCTSNDHPSYVA
ncbi:uncharacterized protein NPIL_674271, partial [Nephila pilipes]